MCSICSKSREIKDINNSELTLLEMKTTMCEMKNILDEINDRLNTAKEKINELKGTTTEPIQNEIHTHTQKMQKLNTILSCRVNFKLPNTWI